MKEIQLTNGGSAVVDDDDLELVSKYKWYSRNGYAVSTGTEKRLMHNLITGFRITDHINGNKLDNRRSNLRSVNQSQNRMNSKLHSGSSTGQRGVYHHNGKYEARITIDYKSIYLGFYPTFEEARRARIDAELKYYGEYSARVCRPEDY